MSRINIDRLRQLFKDPTASLSVKLVRVEEEPEIARKGGSYQVLCETIPDRYEALLTVSQEANLQGGIRKDQIYIAIFVNHDLNDGYLLRQIVNDPFPLHPKAKESETVISSNPKKKINISNDHSATLTENAVLGPELIVWLLKLTEQIKSLADDITTLDSRIISLAESGSWGVAGPKAIGWTANRASGTAEKTKITELEQTAETDKFLSDLLYIQEKDLTNSPE